MQLIDTVPPLVSGVNAALDVALLGTAVLAVEQLTRGWTNLHVFVARCAFVAAAAMTVAAILVAPHVGIVPFHGSIPIGDIRVAAVQPTNSGPAVTPAPVWASYSNIVLFLVWIGGAAFFAGRFLVSLRRLRGMCRRASPAGGRSASKFAQMCRELDIRHAEFLVSSEVSAPCAFGWLRPVVLVPPQGWVNAPDRLEIALTHELHHVRRNDALWLAIAEFAAALHWFNPLIRKLVERYRHDIELLCDGHVVASGVSIRAYIEAIAHALSSQRGPRIPAATMASASGLRHRIEMLRARLHPRRDVSRPLRILVLGTAGVAVAASGSVGVLRESAPAGRAASAATPFPVRRPALSSLQSQQSAAIIPESEVSPSQAGERRAGFEVAAAPTAALRGAAAPDALNIDAPFANDGPLTAEMRRQHGGRLVMRVAPGVVVRIPEIGFGCAGMSCQTSAPSGTRLTLLATSDGDSPLNWSGCSPEPRGAACTIVLPGGSSYVEVAR